MLINMPILMYHSTLGDSSLRVNVTPELLEQHLIILSELGFMCNPVREHLGKNSANSIALTFDDGYVNNLDIIPLLKKYNAGATFFVLTGCEGQTLACHQPREVPLMGADGWEKLHRNGFEIGAHGVTHRKLTALTNLEIRKEIEYSTAAVKAVTNESAIGYAYPFGEMNASAYNIAKELTRYACATRYQFPLREDRWRLRRINIGPADSPQRFRWKLGRLFRVLCDFGL